MNIVCKYISVFLAFLLSFGLFACTLNEKIPNDTEAESTSEPSDTSSEPEPEPEPVTFTLPLSHDKNGRLLYEYTYSEDGLSLSKTDNTEETPVTYTVTFDENGMPLTTEWVIAVNDIRSEKWKDIYTLDKNRNIVEEKRYCEGELQSTYTYTYDEDGRILTQRSYNNIKNRWTDYVLTYDEMGSCVGVTSSLSGAEAQVYKENITNTYDEAGRLLTSTEASYTVLHDYTLNGDLVTNEKVTYVSGEFTWTYYYQYTYENGKLVREDCSFGGELVDTISYTQSEYAHYAKTLEWVFRDRLP